MNEYLIFSAQLFAFTLGYYILVMAIHKVTKETRLHVIAKILIIPFLFFDAAVNILVLSVFFMELPRQWLVTARLKMWRRRYKLVKTSELRFFEKFRYNFAVWFCDRCLDRFDTITGNHC